MKNKTKKVLDLQLFKACRKVIMRMMIKKPAKLSKGKDFQKDHKKVG